MFEFIVDIKEENDNLKQINEALKELKSLEVLIGIPQEKSSRKGKISNAELLYIHTNGSPARNIPARPVIEPAIADSKEILSDLMKQAADSALAGNKEGMRRGLEKAGMQGQNAAREWFTNPKNGWASNSDITVNGSKPDKQGNKFIKGKKSNRPLIDTGEMRKSIVYVVREK